MYLNYQTEKITCSDAVIDEVMIAKVLYDRDCFVYIDEELQRSLPGTIDGAKFTQAQLDTCFTLITKDISISIGGISIGSGNITNPKTISKPIHLYTDGQATPTIMKFTFEESTC